MVSLSSRPWPRGWIHGPLTSLNHTELDSGLCEPSDFALAFSILIDNPKWVLNFAKTSSKRFKEQSSALRTLCEGNRPVPDGSPHKGPVMWKAFPCHDVIMCTGEIRTVLSWLCNINNEEFSDLADTKGNAMLVFFSQVKMGLLLEFHFDFFFHDNGLWTRMFRLLNQLLMNDLRTTIFWTSFVENGISRLCMRASSHIFPTQVQGAVSIRKTVLPGMAIPMLSLTWKSPYADKTVFILRRGPDYIDVT